MPPLVLPITLVTAAGCAFINLWLAIRTSRIRHVAGVSIGDGGDERLVRRMRAQANFVENAPFVLALVALIEFSAGSALWLWAASVLFLIARIAHAWGMDGATYGRAVGTGVTMLLLAGLGLYALVLASQSGRIAAPSATVDLMPATG